MMPWQYAHRLGLAAARGVQRRLDVSLDTRVDIFELIEQIGIVLGFQPMRSLSGAYLSTSGSQLGILINASHPLARQRFTAAHELGHHFLDHASRVDSDRVAPGEVGQSQLLGDERVAEAFAAWFLMPKELIRAALGFIGRETPTSPLDAYRLSLFVGVSYTAAVWHLRNLRLIAKKEQDVWLKVPPAQLKRDLLEGSPALPDSLRNDVWLLERPAHGSDVHVRAGDRVVIDLEEVPSSGYTWSARELPRGCFIIAEDDFASPPDSNGAPRPPGEAALHRTVVAASESSGGGRLALELRPAWRAADVVDEWETLVHVEPERRGVSERWFSAA